MTLPRVGSDISEASYPLSGGCTPVRILASVLGRLLRFPRLSRTCLVRRTLPLDALRHRLEGPRVGLVLPVHQRVKRCSRKGWRIKRRHRCRGGW